MDTGPIRYGRSHRLILINYYASVIVMTSHWIFKAYSVRVCTAGHRLSRPPPDPPRPRHPRPTQQPSLSPSKGGASQLSSASGGCPKVPPGTGEDPRKGRGFHNFRRHFHLGIYFCAPVFSFPFVYMAFFPGWDIFIPPRRFITIFL